jgi:hypothetical protein
MSFRAYTCVLFQIAVTLNYFNPVHLIPGFLSPVVRHLTYEADHSHILNADGKNMWSYTSTAPYILMVLYLFKHRFIIFARAYL